LLQKSQRKTQKGEEVNNLNRPCMPSIHINLSRVLEISVSTARMTNTEQINCTKVTSVHERQKLLSEKKLCFNCTSARRRVDEYKSKYRCQICDRKHYTSIYHNQENKTNPLFVATGIPTGNVTYPVVVEVEGIKCCVLLDTGAGCSYASVALLDRIASIGHKKKVRKIEMLLGASTIEVELATITISDGSP